MKFAGERLAVNFAAQDGGALRVAILDAKGKPVPGFTLQDCQPLTGDAIDQAVSWKGKTDVRPLAGKPIQLRFELKNADLYSFTFGN